jgi:CarD family transcriptional regulator
MVPSTRKVNRVIGLFAVNSCVMFGRTGVCAITDIRTGELIGKPESQYYILRPVYSADVAIMAPVDKQRLMIRELISKQEVISLIDAMPAQEEIWYDDDKLRNEKFTAALNSGLCKEWITLIKSLLHKSDEKVSIGKKLSQTDQNVLKDAKKLLYEEFSYSLDMPFNEVESYIANRIS